MKQPRLLFVPAALLFVVASWLVLDALLARNELRDQFALPDDRSPRSLLQFMRKMDGSSEVSQTFFTTSTNFDSVSAAVLAASAKIPLNSPDLSSDEQREAEFYRLKYLGYSLRLGDETQTPGGIETLIADSKSFLTAADTYSARERMVSEGVLRILDNGGRYSEELEYIHWLESQLEAMQPSTTKDAFAERLDRIASRLELTSKELELLSNRLDNEPFDLESLRGKVVLIEFWGTRCQPCIQDLPALKRIYDTYHDRGFEIVGICLGAEPERIRRFVAEYHLPWIQLCDDQTASTDCNQALVERFGIEAVPTTMLIDAQGRVIAHGVRPLHSRKAQDLEGRLQVPDS